MAINHLSEIRRCWNELPPSPQCLVGYIAIYDSHDIRLALLLQLCCNQEEEE